MEPIQIISKQKQLNSIWSGGTTAQLFIYPEKAAFIKRDFSIRISTASIETETSTFSAFPGFKRILMVLTGVLTIKHQNHYTKTLFPLELDEFDGGWETQAAGKVIDFNILYKEPIKPKCTAIRFLHSQSKTIENDGNMNFGYLFSGNCVLELASGKQNINTHDFVVFNTPEPYTIDASTECCWVIVKFHL
jgi:environmental stress-induced protein Ves